MKRRTVILKRILPCIAALLVLANCKNLFQPQELPPTATAQTGEGTFSLKIGGIRAGRTILPATVQSNFAAYTLVFQADGQTEVSAERTNDTLGEAITLNAGTWNLAVTAFLDSEKTKPAVQGTITAIEISGGENTSGSLELKPLIEAGATGTFRWNINYPTDVTLASMTITPLDEATGTAAQTLYFRGDETLTVKNNAAAPLALNTGYYRVEFNLSKGAIETGLVEYLHIYKNLESRFEHTFTEGHFTVYSVVRGEDSGPGSLRYAIANAAANSTILVEVETINLESSLEIDKNLTIRGNGVTLTRRAAWTETSDTSQLLRISNSSANITVNISRVHFKNGRATYYGAAIYNNGAMVNLESCIFSGNQTSNSSAYGGAIYNYGTMSVKGCTFYNNSSAYKGGAISNYTGTLTLTGNLFYGNTAPYSPVVEGGTVTSSGYNVVDVPLGIATNQSGWTAGIGDKTVNNPQLIITLLSFKLFQGSEAAAVIDTLPEGYPQTDFYGDAIADGAAAGAVQSTASGYFLHLSVNNSSWGSISSTLEPDAEGLVPAGSEVTFTASPAAGCGLINWLVNGDPVGYADSLTRTISGHTTVQAVFDKMVTVFTDDDGSEDTPGTLRYVLTNAQDGDIIRFTGVTAGTTIELGSALPQITKSVTIEGNGVTLTRSAAWTETNDSSQLLYIFNSSADITVNISRVYFKDGRATTKGAAVYNIGETVNLESCIFSGNQTSTTGDDNGGGAIFNSGTMSVKGCTFYNNSSARNGGAILNSSGTLTLTGNLFYGNPAFQGPAVYWYGGTVTSNGYNAVDVALGTENTQSGWDPGIGDKTVNDPLIMITLLSFKPLSGSGVDAVIDTLPEGYPQTDFYGAAIADGAAAGAVQSMASGGYFLHLSENSSSWGSISSTPAPDAEGLVPDGSEVTFTASSAEGLSLVNWLVNGDPVGYADSLTRTISGHTTVQAVFGRVVSVFTDDDGSENLSGTLRYALTKALRDTQDGGIICFTGVTAGTTTIELSSPLPTVTKSITIEGNGVTLTPDDADWTSNNSSQLLYIFNSSADITVNISRVHFKNGRATGNGPAVSNSGETVNLESCIFSGNRNDNSSGYGGAIYTSSGTMSVKGCTFYNNSVTGAQGRGGAIYYASSISLTLMGNLFYDNTVPNGNVVYNYNTYIATVTSNGYNVVDVNPLVANPPSGWTAGTGDTTFSALSISGEPFNTTTFAPVAGLNSVMPSTAPAGFPTVDFNGETRTWPGAPGAVK